MARRNTLRWLLCASVLAAIAIAGCGTAARAPRHKLQAKAEQRLLRLVTRARTDVSAREGVAAHAVLGEFVSEVSTLHSSGELSDQAAARLDRQARASVSAIATQLPAGARRTTATATSPVTLVPPPAQAQPSGDGPGDGHGHDQPPGHDKHHHPHGKGPGDGPAAFVNGGGND